MSVAGLKKQFYKATQVRLPGSRRVRYWRSLLRLGDLSSAFSRFSGALIPAVTSSVPAVTPCPVASRRRPVLRFGTPRYPGLLANFFP